MSMPPRLSQGPGAFREPTLAPNEQVSVVGFGDERLFGSLVTDHVGPKNRRRIWQD